MCLLLPIFLTPNLAFTLDYQWVHTVIYVGSVITCWLLLGLPLKYERIRLRRMRRDRRTATIAFSDAAALQRFVGQIEAGLLSGESAIGK